MRERAKGHQCRPERVPSPYTKIRVWEPLCLRGTAPSSRNFRKPHPVRKPPPLPYAKLRYASGSAAGTDWTPLQKSLLFQVRTFEPEIPFTSTPFGTHFHTQLGPTPRETVMEKDSKADSDIQKWAENKTGEFKRKQSSFRNWIKKDGSTGFPAEAGRYHLYVSYACPWAHRTLITRKLKGLEDVISFDVVDYSMGEKGWRFNPDVPGATSDSLNGFSHLRELYFMVEPDYTGRFTVPVLYDKVKKVIVNNESSEILRMFNSEFNDFCKLPEQAAIDLYPEPLRAEVDALNEWMYP